MDCDLEPNRTRINVEPRPRLADGVKVKVVKAHIYNDFSEGNEGVVESSMWDWPNWEYMVKFNNGEKARVWDYQLQAI